MGKYINCGSINYKNKKVVILLNDDFKKEFYEFENNNLISIKEPFKTELDVLYNKRIEALYLSENMKRKICSLLLVTTILSGSGALITNAEALESGTKISDNYIDNLSYLMNNNLFDSVPLSDSPITRLELCQMLYNLDNRDSVKLMEFEDIKDNEAISWAVENKLINGYENKFYPNDSITKEQMITILYRYINETGKIVIDSPANGCLDNDDVSAYSKKAINWAVKNNLIDISDNTIYPQGLVMKEECITIMNAFVTEYNLFNDNLNMNNNAQKFINVVEKNSNLPIQLKEIFKTYASVINDYDFNQETLNNICSTFGTLKYEYTAPANNFEKQGATAAYYFEDNIIHSQISPTSSDFQSIIIHEGFHALSSNFKTNGLVGFGDPDTGFGIGITEGITEMLANEYANMDDDSYYYSSNLVRFLAEAIGPKELLECYISSDLPCLTQDIMQIYLKQNSQEDSYDMAISLIASFDTINLFETKKMEYDSDFVNNTISELNQLVYLNKGYYIGEDKILNNYYDKIKDREAYFYYNIDNYMFNKKYVTNNVIVSKINKEKCFQNKELSEAISYLGDSDKDMIINNYSQYLETEIIGKGISFENSNTK